MKESEYTVWKQLQEGAADTMIAAGTAAKNGDYEAHQLLYAEALRKQEVADEYRRSTEPKHSQ